MAVYLGSSGERKVILDGVVYDVNWISATPIIDSIVLLSSDDYILKDINGTYLISKESE